MHFACPSKEQHHSHSEDWRNASTINTILKSATEKEGTAYFPIAIHGSEWGNPNSNFKTCLKRVAAYRMTAVNAMP